MLSRTVKHAMLASVLMTACGTKDECKEKAEINTVALSTTTYAVLGAVVDVTATVRDMCPDTKYQGIYAVKEASEPQDCTDGDSQVSGASASWSGLKKGVVYFVRACATTGSYVSTGVTKSVTTAASP